MKAATLGKGFVTWRNAINFSTFALKSHLNELELALVLRVAPLILLLQGGFRICGLLGWSGLRRLGMWNLLVC